MIKRATYSRNYSKGNQDEKKNRTRSKQDSESIAQDPNTHQHEAQGEQSTVVSSLISNTAGYRTRDDGEKVLKRHKHSYYEKRRELQSAKRVGTKSKDERINRDENVTISIVCKVCERSRN